MVEVDWRSIARSEKSLGGEGSNLLRLRARNNVALDVLDAATPDDDGEGPANGGWFNTPAGPMLFIEGLPEQVNPWIERLALQLAHAGVVGDLGGGQTVNTTRIAWARSLDSPHPGWSALLGYRPVPNYLALETLWACGEEALDQAVSHAIDWMCAHGGGVLANVALRADFWADPTAAKKILTAGATKEHVATSQVLNEDRAEIRDVKKHGTTAISLTSRSARVGWRETIGELRAALLAAPLEHVSVAMVSPRDWGDLLHTGEPTYYDRPGYSWYPNRWDEFSLDPCGIQILTNRHLSQAANLDNWAVTRLDPEHFLVESHDLGAWYSQPLQWNEDVHPDLMDQARQDFGEMILTPTIAQRHGLVGNPRFKNTP